MAADPSVEASSWTIASNGKDVFCITNPSRHCLKYGSWLYTVQRMETKGIFDIMIKVSLGLGRYQRHWLDGTASHSQVPWISLACTADIPVPHPHRTNRQN